MNMLLAGLLLALAEPPADPTKDPAKRDLERLQGTWVLVGGEEKGEKLSAEEARKEKQSLIIKGDKMTMIRGRTKDTCAIRLDPGKKPAWLDLFDPSDKSEVNHAIYQLEGDRLTICVSRKYDPNSKEERPEQFTTRRAENKNLRGLVLSIYQRQKR